ncbi:hypothetical protein F3J45_03660 [Pantoea sp. Ap-967]|uniref:hypothetical protein n=1 Tax=Pantoea sp. Ap-967 TaxID=2608362 RepID=UPI00141F759F|nr:hypothetical protein [Pantoea sp. Ap-967]NIE73561.1 hypothetical protein [Pantoea sp. Ap-967]
MLSRPLDPAMQAYIDNSRREAFLATCRARTAPRPFAGLAPALVLVARAWVGEGRVHSSLRAFGVAEVEQAWDHMAAQLRRWADN